MNFELVIYYFSNVYPGFILQLLLAEALFVFKLKRKKFFWIRLVAGIVILAGLTFLLSCVQPLLPENVLLGALPYFIIFAFSVVIMKMCFEKQWKILILCGVAAYCLQNIVYRIGSLFEISGVIWRLYLAIGNYQGAYFIVSLPLMALVYGILYFLFVRRINEKDLENIYSRNVLLISAVTLGVTIILCGYTNSFWWQSFELSIINYCFSVLSNVFIITILSGMFENVKLKSDLETIRQLWEQDRRQYEAAKENIDLINIKCHDLKHKIKALRLADGEISASELKELEKAVEIYDSKIKTGCKPIDVLVSEKSLICIKRGIKLTCMADGSGFGHIGESDLYSLFGNMLSNAIEAVNDIENEDKRIIDLTVKRVAGVIMINCINYFNGELVIKGGVPLTTHADKAFHGFGVKSMQLLVKKYGGELYFTAEDGVFDLKIMLPERAKSNSLTARAA